MNIVFWSTGCPKCKVLKTKLDAAKLDYVENNNKDEMIALGMTTVPCLTVDGQLFEFKEAVDWLNQIKEAQA